MKNKICLFLIAALMSMRFAHAAEIVVAQVADYSSSRAALGKAMRVGAQIAISRANEDGSLGSNKIKFVTYDDRYLPDQTVKTLEKVLDEKRPALVLGILGTANTAAVLKSGVLEKFQVPLIGPYTGADTLRSPVNPWVFHIRSSYAQEVERIIRQYATIGVKRVAVFYENDAFGRFIYASFRKAVEAYKIEEVANLEIERGSRYVKDMADTLQKAEAEGVVIGTAGTPTAEFLKALGQVNFTGHRYGLSVNDIPSILSIAGVQHARGFAQTQVMPDPSAQCRLKVCQEFKADYQRFGDPSISPSPSMMEGYLAAKLAIAAIRRIKGNVDHKTVYAALNGIGEVDLNGFLLNYSHGQRTGSRYIDIGVVNHGGKMAY